MKNLLFILLLASSGVTGQKSYFVAASGNDANDGSQATPLKTIGKVNSLPIAPGDKIFFNGGDTFFGSLIPKSGTQTAPIIISSYGTGKARITGFSDVTNWQQAGNIWTSALSVSSVNMITIGGVFVPIGKFPNGNKSYITATSASATSVGASSLTGTWTGGQVVIRKNHWIIDKAQVTSQSGTNLNFTNPNSYVAQVGWGFFIQNIQAACDLQNEWFFSGGKLGMFSVAQPAGVKATTTDNLVQVNDKSFINFSNITFTGSNSNAVTITTGHDIGFDGCDFIFQGINGINAQSSAHHIKVNNCISNWTNNNFINAGGAKNWIITNNSFSNIGQVPGMGNSSDGNYIAVYNIGDNSLVQNNTFKNCGYIGVDFRGASITVDRNSIDVFCNTKDDGAGIYTFSSSSTSYSQRYVTNNTISNGGGASAGTNTTNSDAFGIYMDNNSSDVTITDNYVHDNGGAGLFIHGATRITAARNIIYNCVMTGGYGQFLVITGKGFGATRNMVITNNQFISKTTSQNAGYFKTDSSNYSQWGRFDSNYYAGNRINIAGTLTDLAGWRSRSGMEAKSVTGLPQTTPPIIDTTTLVFKNVAQSKAFTKNNCTSGTGTSVVYTVAAGKYTASTQAGADQLATNDINNNGQNYANVNGTCIPKTIIKVVIYYSDGSTVTQQ